MSESFADLFEQSLHEIKFKVGSVVKAHVLQIDPDSVIVDAGFKTEGIIPVREFYNDAGEIEVVAGDYVDVVVEKLEDGFGETVFSREKARISEHWTTLETAQESGESVMGTITEKVKGGFTVMLGDIRAFLPGSLVDVRPVRDTTHLEGNSFEFKCIKIDRKRNNVVVSRRAILEDVYSEERKDLLDNMEEGQVLKGIVKNLTDYGAFVDLGGIDGLLHITDMAWRRIRHPSELVNVGDEIEVIILKFDKEKVRVSLGLKQLGDDPWKNLTERYPVGTRLQGQITNVTDYGCFVQLEEGVEGLVHMSEMDWTNRNVQPGKLVQSGDEVEVMVLDIDQERRRISLGLKQCKVNPWEDFLAIHKKGDQISGVIKSITDFGIFIELPGNIDGLVHLSDISWSDTGENAIRNYKKGDEVTAMVLLVDAERERISLGIKQLESDPLSDFVAMHGKGSVVTGTVKSVDAREAIIDLGEEVEGTLRASELSEQRVEDATTVLSVGQKVEALVISADSKTRRLQLSIKALNAKEESDRVAEYRTTSAAAGTTSLGALLKEQMDVRSGEKEDK